MSFDAIDSSGIPKAVKVETEVLPLWPVAFVEWLEPRLTKQMHVFEFGSGNGTLWLARRVASTVSVEHHVHYKDALTPILPDNSALVYVPMSRLDQYPNVIEGFRRKFDIVIVDGMLRDACIRLAVDHLTPDGVLILDNSDCEAFESQVWLKRQGWNSITLRGKYLWTDDQPHDTRVFFRDGNCLGI